MEHHPLATEESLAGQVALVTGAGAGIGQAIAQLFARHGALVAVVDINQDRAKHTVAGIRQGGGRALVIQADVSQAAQVERAVRQAVQEYKRLDIVVNNAGIGMLGTVWDTTEEDWDRILAVNLKSVFLVCRQVIPEIRKQGQGRIINIASTAGLVASPGRAAYCASKGGVVLLTKALALDCAPLGITVNAICPGTVETEMTRESLRDPVDYERRMRQIPLKRIAQPHEIAGAALYLASPAASFVTGAALPVDGGWTAH